METFKYQPLDLKSSAFRLIRLLKGPAYSNIECQLIYTTLDENVIEYEAISYTWGTSVKAFSIKLDGAKFMVMPNLWHLLGNIRKVEEDRYLWVDAIAINQDDSSERGHQVQRMQDIYSGAERVIVYLGEETASINVLMESLFLLQRLTRGRRWEPDDERWKSTWEKVQSHRGGTYMEVTQREGLKELLRRPWFRRAWVLQEVANARRALILCGTSSVHAHIFVMAPALIGMVPDSYVSAIFELMPTHRRISSEKIRSKSFYSALFEFSHAETSDPRDKIFALLGICNADVKKWVVPDYTRSEFDIVNDVVCYLSGDGTNIPLLAIPPLLSKARGLLKQPVSEIRAHDVLSEAVRLLSEAFQYLPTFGLLQTGAQLWSCKKSLDEIFVLLSEDQWRRQILNFPELSVKAKMLLSSLAGSVEKAEEGTLPKGDGLPSWRGGPLAIHSLLGDLSQSQEGYMESLILNMIKNLDTEDMRCFLLQRASRITMSLPMIGAAAANESNGMGIMDLLLQHGNLGEPFSNTIQDKELAWNIFHFAKGLGTIQGGVVLSHQSAAVPVAPNHLYSLLFFASQHPLGKEILNLDIVRTRDMVMWEKETIPEGVVRLQEMMKREHQSSRRFWRRANGETQPAPLEGVSSKFLQSISKEISYIPLESDAHTAEILGRWPLLLLAIASEEIDLVKRLMSLRPGAFDTHCESAGLALNLAAESLCEPLVRFLLKKGVKMPSSDQTKH